MGLNLPVKAGNLQESLLQFVKDELLDGDNSYNCEECSEKVRNFVARGTLFGVVALKFCFVEIGD